MSGLSAVAVMRARITVSLEVLASREDVTHQVVAVCGIIIPDAPFLLADFHAANTQLTLELGMSN